MDLSNPVWLLVGLVILALLWPAKWDPAIRIKERQIRAGTHPEAPPPCEHDWLELPEGHRFCRTCKRAERWQRGEDMQWGWHQIELTTLQPLLDRMQRKNF